MFNIRFFIAWIISGIAMYGAFYLWHGILSNDFYKIQYPQTVFLGFAAIAYLAISFVLYKVYSFKFWSKITQNLFLRGILSGISLGFVLFCIIRVLGVGFSTGISTKILLIDLLWQLLEQSFGGIIVALSYFFIFIPDLEENNAKNS